MEHEYMVSLAITFKNGQSGHTRFFPHHIGAVTRDTIEGWEKITEEVCGCAKAVVIWFTELYTNGTGHMEADTGG